VLEILLCSQLSLFISRRALKKCIHFASKSTRVLKNKSGGRVRKRLENSLPPLPRCRRFETLFLAPNKQQNLNRIKQFRKFQLKCTRLDANGLSREMSLAQMLRALYVVARFEKSGSLRLVLMRQPRAQKHF
jgi:hypothetical protein